MECADWRAFGEGQGQACLARRWKVSWMIKSRLTRIQTAASIYVHARPRDKKAAASTVTFSTMLLLLLLHSQHRATAHAKDKGDGEHRNWKRIVAGKAGLRVTMSHSHSHPEHIRRSGVVHGEAARNALHGPRSIIQCTRRGQRWRRRCFCRSVGARMTHALGSFARARPESQV